LLFTIRSALGSRRSLASALDRDGLRDFSYQKRLEIGLRSGPLQADNGMPGLARHKIAFSIGAGYFKFAGLALQSLGNVVG
jgi:hypothetical protein